MTFINDKKTFLTKLDKSKKGEIDDRVLPIMQIINSWNNFYTTSSCSGRVYLWKGTGKKNETEWLNVNHDFINSSFLEQSQNDVSMIWLRVEPFIMHLCCEDLDTAIAFLENARTIYKKSNILSISHKIIIEIRGSEMMELPLYYDGKLLWNGNLELLVSLVNDKLKRIFRDVERFQQLLLTLENK